MFLRALLIVCVALVGALLGQILPPVGQLVRSMAASLTGSAAVPPQTNKPIEASNLQDLPPIKLETLARVDPKPSDGAIVLSAAQISSARIETATATSGALDRHLTVPGTIAPDANKVGRVAVKLPGTIAQLNKSLGDNVEIGEVVAVLESREVADAKSEFLAARLSGELQQTLFEREKLLWDKRISSEQQFLRARGAADESRIRVELTRQRLFALGLSDAEIGALPQEPVAELRRQEIRSPVAGRVVERRVDVGAAVGRDSLETELFVIVDLAKVWVELAVSVNDLKNVQEGQTVRIEAGKAGAAAEGKVVFISPLLDKETKAARVIAEIPNPNGLWRPGTFVTVEIVTSDRKATTLIPMSAIQTIAGDKVIFVRTPEGFQKRRIVVGRSDDRVVEVLTGAEPGEEIAVRNTFKLKAELGKAQAED
jgi:membrane fusion protein, heavy metal efflux system